MQLGMRWLPDSNQRHIVVAFLIIFGVHMNMFFIIKVRILVLIDWSYMSLQLCQLLSLK